MNVKERKGTECKGKEFVNVNVKERIYRFFLVCDMDEKI